jgi:hypothetical protein
VATGTAAEQVVARLDSYPQEKHLAEIRAARQRAETKRAARKERAKAAADRLWESAQQVAEPETIHIPQGFADHFGIPAGPYRLKQPSDRTATPDAGTTREQEGRAEVVDRIVETARQLALVSGMSLREALDTIRVGADLADAAEQRERAEAAEAIVEQVRASVREPYVLADALCRIYHDGRDGLTGFVVNERFVVSCAECKAHAREVLAAILDGAQTPQTTPQTRDVAAGAPGSASGGTETGEALEGAQGGEER